MPFATTWYKTSKADISRHSDAWHWKAGCVAACSVFDPFLFLTNRYDTFHDEILRPCVAVVPPERYSGIAFQDFNMADAKHRARLWIGRIELFFMCTFRDRNGVEVEYDLAFISFLYDFKLPAAMGPLQRTAGARMFYVPSKPWTMVLSVNHILGKVPLMRVYLGGSCAPTIPHSFAGQKQRYFKRGCADQAGANGVGSGSMLFEVNVHLWQFAKLGAPGRAPSLSRSGWSASERPAQTGLQSGWQQGRRIGLPRRHEATLYHSLKRHR